MILVENISKTFGAVRVLHNINFHIKKGEFVTLLGVNGAGKTTLIRILATLARATHGTARIAGYSLKKEKNDIRQQIGVMSHSTFLYGDLSAEENLRFYSKMYSVPDYEQRINELLQHVNLASRRYDLVRTFSRGMQQRLSLARAILHNPQILLLDEPFAGLDVTATKILTELLHEYVKNGITILLTTHDIHYALNNAQRVIVINQGQVAKDVFTTNILPDQITHILENIAHKN